MENCIEIINARFNEELQQQIDGILPKGHVYKLGFPSEALLSNMKYAPIELSAGRLDKKSKQRNHLFDLSEIKNLPKAVNNPIMVFESTDKDGTTIVLTELKDKSGYNFVVAIRIRYDYQTRINQAEVNDIRSIYPKDHFEGVLDWINSTDKLLKWTNKEKAFDFIQSQSPEGLEPGIKAKANFTTKILQNFENPKFL